ncbi:MAG: hypothetical protein ABJA93_05125 [Sporichthyaceae bacterium]
MAEQPGTTTATDSRDVLLGIYLNDHLAGATGGLELARRTAGAHQGTEAAATVSRLAKEIQEDREALLELMASLQVPVRQYKVYSAWVAEKVGRLKLNGRLRERSPMSSLVELETLRLGVEGKACLWRTLLLVAKDEPRLDASQLHELLDRTTSQLETVESLRIKASAEAFTTSA